jgi:hypothetical protein
VLGSKVTHRGTCLPSLLQIKPLPRPTSEFYGRRWPPTWALPWPVPRAHGVQIAARHADPRITTRYDRARKNLDRYPNYILAANMASGT